MAPPGSRRPAELRIIAGRWRGRRFRFPDIEGLRPTPDRVRETLFNWLQPSIEGARCLDLFAGSGALGLEALSRDAAAAVFVERDPRAADALRANLQKLAAAEESPIKAEVIEADACAFLAKPPPAAFDLVFLDPPFQSGLLQGCFERLTASRWIRPGGLVYIEAQKQREQLALPASWERLRSKTAGQVVYELARQTT